MYTFYLDSTQVNEPESFTNIVFEKKRVDNLFGFVFKNEGKVLGAGQIKFTEEKAVAILRAAINKYGYGAEVKFRVDFMGKLAYEGTVNLWNSEWYPESVVVTFTDGSPTVKFLTNSSKRYQLTPNAFQTLTSTGIVGKTTHQILSNLTTYKKKTVNPVNYSHPVPFQAIEGSSNSNVNNITDFSQILPLYTNDAEKKTISIKGVINFNVKTSNSGSFNLKLNDLIVQEFISDLTPSDEVGVIDRTITLLPYETISISIESTANSSDTQFVYDLESTTLSINEIKDNLQPTEVPVLSSFDMMSQLVDKASEGTLTLESTFLKEFTGAWTNGRNLRGVSDVINCSFDDVFDDLNKMKCLYVTVSENKVKIEKRINIIRNGSKSYLDRDWFLEEVKVPNREYLYSSIKAGYKNWQGESALSNQEVNATLEFESNLFGRENVLDLECDCISSGILIEEIRQTQFGKVSTDQQKKYDDKLVILIPNDGADNYINVGLNQDIRNLSIRPYQMMLNHAEVYGGYLYWQFISGLGNYSASINNEKQSKKITTFGNIIGSAFWDLEYLCELDEYTNIGEVIQWTDTLGKGHEGVLYQAEWSTSKSMFLQVMENETI